MNDVMLYSCIMNDVMLYSCIMNDVMLYSCIMNDDAVCDHTQVAHKKTFKKQTHWVVICVAR